MLSQESTMLLRLIKGTRAGDDLHDGMGLWCSRVDPHTHRPHRVRANGSQGGCARGGGAKMVVSFAAHAATFSCSPGTR